MNSIDKKDQKKPGPDTLGPLMTIKEAAKLLRLSLSKAYTMLDYRCPGGIPTVLFGRCRRIKTSDFYAWVASYPASTGARRKSSTKKVSRIDHSERKKL